MKTETIDSVIERLNALKEHKAFGIFDFGDIGNEMGIAIAQYAKDNGHLLEDDMQGFKHGIDHGISLIDGSHDAPLGEKEQAELDLRNKEMIEDLKLDRLGEEIIVRLADVDFHNSAWQEELQDLIIKAREDYLKTKEKYNTERNYETCEVCGGCGLEEEILHTEEECFK